MEQGSLVTGLAAAPAYHPARRIALASCGLGLGIVSDHMGGTQTVSHALTVIQRSVFVRYELYWGVRYAATTSRKGVLF